MVSKLFSSLRHDGPALTLRGLWSKTANKVFNLTFLPGRFDLHIDRSARILGLSHVQIGKNFTAGKHLWLEAVLSHGKKHYKPQILIGNNVSCGDRVHIGSTNFVQIGHNVLMASDIYISDHNHGSYAGSAHSSPQEAPNHREVNDDRKVVIGDNVWVGERVCILPGVVIGEGSVIGAGSIVTKDVPKHSIVVGNPAKVVKKYDPKAKEWRSVSKSAAKKR